LLEANSIFVIALEFIFSLVPSRLDVARICHSRGHTETRQHPSHRNNVDDKRRNEPRPVRHTFDLLSLAALTAQMADDPALDHVIDPIDNTDHSFIMADNDHACYSREYNTLRARDVERFVARLVIRRATPEA